GQWTVGKNRGVFDWDVLLIIKAVGHPAAQCLLRQPPFVHGDMERVFVVIRARADGAQVFEESFAVPKLGRHISSLIRAHGPARDRNQKASSRITITSTKKRIHMTISNPSRAISIPDCFTWARSRELGIRI